MDLRQLRYLVVLEEEQHFTRAARRLGIAQPALSQQVRRLEAELGLQLLERTTRTVAMTAAGRTLVGGARRVLREVELLGDELDALRGVRSGRVVLGVTRTPGAVDVVGLLARFHREHPGIELDVREDLSVTLIAQLEAGVLDLALVAEGAPSERAGLQVRTIASEPLVAIVPPEHALAGGTAVSIADLAGAPLMAFRRGATIRDQLERRAFDAGVVLTVAFEIADARRARELVAHGLAIGVLPASDAHAPGPDVATLPLAGPPLVHRTAVATRRGRRATPAAAAFLASLGAGPVDAEG